MRLLSFTMLALLVSLPAVQAADHPHCSVRSGETGGPAIVVDDRVLSPLFFVGNNQFDQDQVLYDQIRLAAEADIDLFGINLRLDWSGNTPSASDQAAPFCEANPDGFFYARVWLGPPPAWLDAHPDDELTGSDGHPYSRGRWVSPASEAWRDDAGDRLEALVRDIVDGPYARQFLGIHLAYLQTGEWFYPKEPFFDYSPANREAFRAWLKSKYRMKRRFRKAWGDSSLEYDGVMIPTPDRRDQGAWGMFRDPAAHRPVIDYQTFLSEQIVDTIAHFARVVKRTTNERSLVGVFYGYTLQLNQNGPRALAQSGHLALDRLLQLKDIDLVHAPYAYFQRAPGQAGHFHLPVDSLALHGKLGVMEDDTVTHLAKPPPDGIVVPHTGGADNFEQTAALARRNFGLFASHRTGQWFFDLLSDGRWNSREFWSTTGLMRRAMAESRDAPLFKPEVAFVVDEASVHALRAKTWPVLVQSLAHWRVEMGLLGAPVGYYLQSDLARIPDSVKVLILANPYILSDEARRDVEKFLARQRTVIWTYAPDIVGENGLGLDRVEPTTGVAVEERFDSVPMAITSERTDETVNIDKESWQPRFVVTTTEGEILARYSETDEVSAIAVPYMGGVSVYTATPRLPVGLLRWICEKSGVHLYTNEPAAVQSFGPYLFCHADKGRKFQFTWPHEFDEVERLVPYISFPFATDTNTWADVIPEGMTAVYRVKQ